MGDQQNISQILAALAAQRPGGTPGQASGSPQLGQTPTHAFPVTYPTTTPPANIAGYPLPPPDNTGSLDISGPKPIPTGSGGIAEAIAKARGIAAEKGIVHDPSRVSQQRGPDPRHDPRAYHRSRSPSRTPPRVARETYRDNYNPYRDERRGDRHGGNDRGYVRERSFSPRPAGRGGSGYSPPPSRRHWGGDRSPPGRRAGGSGGLDDNQETMNIEANLVGLIIGRAGDNLRRIESDTGTRIQFLDTDPTRSLRLCKITGSKAARSDAKDEIARMISEHRRMGGGGGPPDRAPRPPHHASQDEDSHTHIMVPDRTVGLIIGRGGETIRDLQERSGCHVSIVAENKSVNGLRPVNLAGSPESVARAKDMLLEIVESDSRQMANPPQREPRGGYPPSGGDYGGGSGERVTDSLMIPPDAVGMIIGKRGDTIKDIQSYTGCKINIQPGARRDSDREVTMTGSRDAIEQARQIILDKLESEEYRGRPPPREEPYGERYPKSQHQPYYQDSNAPPTQQQPQATQGAGGGAENGADPYAMYGGYQNYIAMCYAYMAQQQQQQGGQAPPGQDGAPKPPDVP